MTLEGIRVIDFSQYLPGPYATQRLAILGAEVIKIEPLTGEPAREFGRVKDGNKIFFEVYNRNKKSMTLNLKSEQGQILAKELIEKADVVVESFRPGVMDRLGLSYEQVKKFKENIIYCSISGYGQKGEIAQLGSHDINYMSLSGILSQLKDQQGKPILPSITLADLIGGIIANEKILSALIHRERTGKGQFIDLSITNTMVSLMDFHIVTKNEVGGDKGIPEITGEIISYNIYETKDGRYVSLAALEPKFWKNFCLGVGRNDWLSAHFSKAIKENVVYTEIKELFLSKTLDEWTRFGLEVDCCLTPILEVGEVENHPLNRHNRYLFENNLSPGLGEHTERILIDLLKKSEEEVAQFQAKGVI
ncbi:alpha-methylacyl-CoA racemase [Vulcanibacillus modesticaldus]|uniref:Alpha-methylacyl-CoA racemase n=1 Tax=Vulcanibacillus modesticaldus TaxID=337097 RepID=A0A1D2YX19_9BACI|nr:CoA transferase [Vulcanibacillus modesticaldus]OEG00206.1 alpha-methylacyl-CoA racemase [Vulcanibacillus modesticaldus]